ncbi:MAG: glutathione S-transferase family protein [Holosporales bacterium]
MIELHQFPYIRGIQMSPYCLKLEAWLRMADIPYRIVTTLNPKKGPHGKLPFIKDGSMIIPDSQLCIDYLSGNHRIDLDEGLSPDQKAEGHAIRRMLEDAYIYTLVYARWIYEPGWRDMKALVFKNAPPVLGDLAAWFLRRKIRSFLHQQGLMRHTESVIFDFGLKDLQMLSMLLESRPYVLGDQPTTVDATVFAFVEATYRPAIDTPLRSFVMTQPALLAYCERMRKDLFSNATEKSK